MSKIKINDSAKDFKPCSLCNPKKYIKFNFSFISYESKNVNNNDIIKFYERMRELSLETFDMMIFKFGRDKSKWFETLPLNTIRKDIPEKFKEIFPSNTYTMYYVMRVYPSGIPNGSANPRIIGMLKDTIFYIFYLDWDGKLYKH